MKVTQLVAAAAIVGLGVRLARSRSRRLLHPAGRSFTGHLEVWGSPVPLGSTLIDGPGRYRVTVRLSKGAGTRHDRPDILGVAIRLQHRGRDVDLLLSTSGGGRLTRHVPVPRRSFDTRYGSIAPYRAGDGGKVYLAAGPDPEVPPLGRNLESVVAAAEQHGAGLLLWVERDRLAHAFGRVSFGTALPAPVDAALAFDPVRNYAPGLYPTGVVQGVRAATYRLSQWWRGAAPTALTH